MSARQPIMVVGDERDIASLIRLHLTNLDYPESVTADGGTGFREAMTGPRDLKSAPETNFP